MLKAFISILILSQGLLFAHCDGCGTDAKSTHKHGTLKGNVKYNGSKQERKPVTSIKDDPDCGAAHEGDVLSEKFIVDDNMNVKNVIVWLKDVKYDGEMISSTAELDQKGCIYDPHVFAVMSGQEILVKNSDPITHNIHALPKVSSSFNSGQPPSVPLIKSFDKAEDPFKIKCDIHPWMTSWVLVQDHPYFAITDDKGNFSIENIPAGTYTVQFWQEKLSRIPASRFVIESNTMEIQIADGEILDINFSFNKPQKK